MQKQTLDDSDDSVGIMVQLTFESKFEAAVSEAQIKFADAASLFPGHIKSESKKIARSQQSMTSVIAMHCFESTDHLIRWLESDRRKSLMQAFDQRFRDHVKVRYPQATDGFSAWTGEGADNTTPKSSFFLRMKTNLLVLARFAFAVFIELFSFIVSFVCHVLFVLVLHVFDGDQFL